MWGRIQIMTTPTGAQEPADKPTVYRGPGAVFGGAIVLVFCLGGSIDLLVEEGTTDMVGAAVMLLVAAFAFAYGVYPAAFSGSDALVVRNPLRTITLPWGAVTRLSAQLSYIAHTATQKYTVWAVPVSLRDRRKAERARLKEMARQHREEQRGQSRLAGGFGGSRSQRPGSDLDRLSYADQATSEMNARREAWLQRAGITDPEILEGGGAPATDERASLRWNPVSIAPIAAAVVFVIVAALVG
jgi:hypothetical protein